MTEQFKPGLVYATRGGDRVEMDKVDCSGRLPLRGRVLTGQSKGDVGKWYRDGRLYIGHESPFDLLPGALPDPATDDKAELLAALRADKAALLDALEELRSRRASVASGYDRHGPTWTEKDGRETYNADYVVASAREDAEYARAAIAKAERT